jgi:hypothetical protein
MRGTILKGIMLRLPHSTRPFLEDFELVRLFVAAVVAAGGYALLIWWFAHTDFYGTHFFDHGHRVSLYLLMRVVFIVAVAWLIYAPGAAALVLVSGTAPLTGLTAGERYALGFFTGAGLWHLILFCVGLAGGYTHVIAVALTLPVMIFSAPHLLFCIDEARDKRPRTLGVTGEGAWRNLAFLAALICTGALFVGIKGLYPAGGHDYYTHYFQYYSSVVRNGSILPNEVWYQFYYSKGAGLHFLAMLLTDPLAPQLVGTVFIAAGALTVAVMLNRVAPGTLFPWIGALLYVTFLIFTPGPPENMRQGGWGDLEKLHELSAVMLLGILWISTHLTMEQKQQRRMWLTALACAVVASTLITTLMAVVVGAFFTALAAWGLCTRQNVLAWAALFGAAVAGISLAAMLAINYALTGLPIDQALLYAWPIVDLGKINRWGVLSELLWLHFGMTGFWNSEVPLTWGTARLLFQYLRLEIWWPVAVLGIAATAWGLRSGRWRKLMACPGFELTLRNLLIFTAIFSLIAIGPGAGRQQTISFYRFSSFTYGPTLCTVLLLCMALPNRFRFRILASGTVVASMVALFLLATSRFGEAVFGQTVGVPDSIPVYSRNLRDSAISIVDNASRLLVGRLSLKDAYQNQQGWPGRLPWGGIYPPMEKAWELVGRGTPIYSLHTHSYCMLPGCRVFAWMSTRTAPDLDVVLFGEPDQAVNALKQAGMNFFFVSKELDVPNLAISSPLVLSPVLSPDSISRYLGVKWTDGSSYLLTWLADSVQPLDQGFLATYRNQVGRSQMVARFPIKDWKAVFAHFREKGLHPYRLPWCKTCEGMPSD